MKIVIASNNVHKAEELRIALAQADIKIVLQSQLKIDSVKEDGLTFVENAILKARHACKHSGMPAIADDSGLEVEALANEPGIYSSRYAGDLATDSDNIAKLLLKLHDVPESKRGACFQTVIVFLKDAADPSPIICQGSWRGKISFAPKGKNGFGYDPVFFLPDYNCTAAELPVATKNKISHRAIALQKLISSLKKEGYII